jgi:hypothetical protein
MNPSGCMKARFSTGATAMVSIMRWLGPRRSVCHGDAAAPGLCMPGTAYDQVGLGQ